MARSLPGITGLLQTAVIAQPTDLNPVFRSTAPQTPTKADFDFADTKIRRVTNQKELDQCSKAICSFLRRSISFPYGVPANSDGDI
ncbi:hypothetical protein [Edaphobacter aggregans]|uniref:hypothetical protein n=1 Tax=Edaphobacter aggregans TaxID=570835 RepID=UPI0012FC5289|nr:hypothetical protein [Edaphobacter aggregans]